jgi:hypothetical protein
LPEKTSLYFIYNETIYILIYSLQKHRNAIKSEAAEHMSTLKAEREIKLVFKVKAL